MKYRIDNIRLSLEAGMEQLKLAAAAKLGVSAGDIRDLRIAKESVDARRKPRISIVYSVLVELAGSIHTGEQADVRTLEMEQEEEPKPGSTRLEGRPIIIGSGPAGLFAGLVLSQHGYRPLLIERGDCVEKRVTRVERYWSEGILDPETNVQFGEGGAGTFSDGKLTTRIHDRRGDKVLREFYNSGAPEEILYRAKPHIGTDLLRQVVINLRKRIEANGGEVLFNTRLETVQHQNGCVTGVKLAGGDVLDSRVVVLAVGHSARDTFENLLQSGVTFEQKPFSIGVRIEHPQELINRAQYGQAAGHPRLGTADYQVFFKTGGRTVYSFCMCPGGLVVASASEAESIVTNGMSEYARDRENANSALVVSVGPGDFGGNHPLAGVAFQRQWEQLAFKIAGGKGAAPVQRLEDFLAGNPSTRLGTVRPSYTGEVCMADLNRCLPEFVTAPMKGSMDYFNRRLQGFSEKDAVLTGVETRTSSPVRIPRGDTLEALGIRGLYPAGEGAGYAGGIVSAAVDGIRIAEQIIQTWAPPV